MSAGHIRQRSGSWEIRYDLAPDPVTGKRQTRTATVRGTKRDAQVELRRLLGQVDRGEHADPRKLTVGDWLEQWLEEVAHKVSPKTFQGYAQIVRQHLIPALGALRLALLAAVHIQGYYNRARASGRRDGKGGLSARTVHHHDRVLNIAFKRARKLGLIAANPTEDATPPKVERQGSCYRMPPGSHACSPRSPRPAFMRPPRSPTPPACGAAKCWRSAGPTATSTPE